MINEKQFVDAYSHFWKSALPMAHLFIKKLNTEFAETESDPIDSSISGRRRSFTSQIAYHLSFDSIQSNYTISTNTSTNQRIQMFEELCRAQFFNYEKDEVGLTEPLRDYETDEIIQLSMRMVNYLGSKHSKEEIVKQPKFKGCGFLESCYGDLIVGKTLYEIKMVNRNFRNEDIKQLLVYAALNHASKQYVIDNLALYNPLKGKYYNHSMNRFCVMISGKTSNDLLDEIIEYISGGDLSR